MRDSVSIPIPGGSLWATWYGGCRFDIEVVLSGQPEFCEAYTQRMTDCIVGALTRDIDEAVEVTWHAPFRIENMVTVRRGLWFCGQPVSLSDVEDSMRWLFRPDFFGAR